VPAEDSVDWDALKGIASEARAAVNSGTLTRERFFELMDRALEAAGNRPWLTEFLANMDPKDWTEQYEFHRKKVSAA
jgi:hypothetical protein